MRFKTTLRLLAAVLVMGAVIWFIDSHVESSGPGDLRGSRLLGVPLDQLTYLSIEHGDSQIDCLHEDGRWLLKKPVEASASVAGIDRILGVLESLVREEVITTEECAKRDLHPQDYGLADPRARVRLGNDQFRYEILVGDSGRPDKHVYVKLTGSGDIICTSSDLLSVLPTGAGDLRDRTVWKKDPMRAVRIEMQLADTGFIQLLKVDGAWRLQQPVVAKADAGKVTGLLRALSTVTVESFVWDPPLRASLQETMDGVSPEAHGRTESYGLAQDEATVRIGVWTVGDDVGCELILGKAHPDRQSETYARMNHHASVFTVQSNLLASLSVSVEGLRDARLFPVNPALVQFVLFESEGAKIFLERDAVSGWNIRKPVQRLADGKVVKYLVRALTEVRVNRFVREDDADLAQYGLDLPEQTIIVSTEPRLPEHVDTIASAETETADAVRAPHRLLLGTVMDEDGDRYAKFSDEDSIFTVAPDTFSRLGLFPLDPMIFFDRTVLSVNPANVSRISLKKYTGEQTIIRDVAGQWVSESPVGWQVGAKATESILFFVSNLRASRIVAHGAEDLGIYGLNEPSTTLTLGLSGGEAGIQKSLMVGFRTQPAGLYAMVQGQDVVFVLPSDVVDALVGDITEPPPQLDE